MEKSRVKGSHHNLLYLFMFCSVSDKNEEFLSLSPSLIMASSDAFFIFKPDPGLQYALKITPSAVCMPYHVFVEAYGHCVPVWADPAIDFAVVNPGEKECPAGGLEPIDLNSANVDMTRLCCPTLPNLYSPKVSPLNDDCFRVMKFQEDIRLGWSGSIFCCSASGKTFFAERCVENASCPILMLIARSYVNYRIGLALYLPRVMKTIRPMYTPIDQYAWEFVLNTTTRLIRNVSLEYLKRRKLILQTVTHLKPADIDRLCQNLTVPYVEGSQGIDRDLIDKVNARDA